MMARPRVLIIDDSAFARTVLGRLLRASGLIDVVGTVRDGREGLERIAVLDPDVVTLDLTMPQVDGLGVLRALQGRSRPRVIVVSMSTIESEIGAEALTLGAIDLIAKPSALATDRLHEIGNELIAKVLAAAAGYAAVPIVDAPPAPRVASRVELIMIGTSTGGPQALTRVITALPAGLAVPVAIVLHIPAGYTQALARRLDKAAALDVVEAHDGLELRPGQVILARGGMHLRIERDGAALRARIGGLPVRPFTPSVDELFTSGAAAVGAGALGVVMTGMGDDGLVGSRAIAEAGGSLITESASTCVVYGMPRCVDEARLGALSIPLDGIAAEIASRV
ncbi:MAG: chemotaxis-specific protein-glutamate methyltransferase CheB [Deltaproteobacteria bacterium]|nr:chemotaxis-specific protein-glutamate methyltransferase CheB [Deltaproteobacteria bacterium]